MSDEERSIASAWQSSFAWFALPADWLDSILQDIADDEAYDRFFETHFGEQFNA